MLHARGWILRSGGADGADRAFERGVANRKNKEIFLPWRNYNNRPDAPYDTHLVVHKALEIAATIHPVWKDLSESVKQLHARNIHQVLGKNLDTPSKFLVCWTKGGKPVGGTRTAIIVAQENNIPVFNINTLELKKKTAISIVEQILDLVGTKNEQQSKVQTL